MSYYYPKSGFIISGQNLNFVDRVVWGEKSIENIQVLDTTGISGRLPADAVTAPVFVETASESINVGVKGVVLAAGNQVQPIPLAVDSVSGKAGDLITIQGHNYVNITEVNFGGVSSEFSTTSSEEIQAIVPENADYSKITVFNGLNTGINGSITEASGLTPNEFVPIPQITGLSSGQLVSGEVLTILGSSFSGVTGVSFNSIEADSVTVPSSTEIEVTIPSGNTKGVPRLLLKSGQYVDAASNYTFTPSVRVDAIKNSAGSSVGAGLKTGELFKLEGANFSTGILYATGDGYLWSLGETTGTFSIINDTEISGLVPTGIEINLTGEANPSIAELEIKIYSQDYPNSYLSDVNFPPTINPPVITHYQPNLNSLPFGSAPTAFSSGCAVGITGDVVTAFGENLIGITGVQILPAMGGNVGVGSTADFTTFSPSPDGKSMSLALPTGGGVFGNYGEFFTAIYSGRFGENTGVSSVFMIGEAFINNQLGATPGIDPATNVTPGTVGKVRGRSFVSGSEVLLYKNNFNDENLISSLPTSGYENSFNWTEVSFTYPNAFETGINYKLTVKNPRGLADSNPSYQDFSIETIPRPTISGFIVNTGEGANYALNYADYPTTGDTTDSILMSGFFGSPSGSNGLSDLSYEVRIGNVTVDGAAINGLDPAYPGFTWTGTHTPFLTISASSLGGVSGPITVITSGGVATSEDIVEIIPGRPSVSGFYQGGGQQPFNPATDIFNGRFGSDELYTYYGDGNLITVTGSRMGLVTGIEFSGQNNNIISTNLFKRRAGSYITFAKPEDTSLESGIFQLADSFGRKVKSALRNQDDNMQVSGIKAVTLSGMDNIAMPGESISVTGNYITGANTLYFPMISGGETGVRAYSTVNNSNNVQTNKYHIPTGVLGGSLRFANETKVFNNFGNLVRTFTSNPELFNGDIDFEPLTEVKGVHPFPTIANSQAVYSTGENIIITGINAGRFFNSGDLVVGISGTGSNDTEASVYFYPVTGYETGSGLAGNLQYANSPAQPNTFYNNIAFQLDSGFIGTGTFFITNPWENFDNPRNEFIGSESENFLSTQINNFPGPFKYNITGTPVSVTGYGPTRGITGSLVEATGEGLDPVTGVFFEIDNGPRLEADFTINSSSHISITVPKEGIEARGMTNILLSGGTNTTINNFEVLLDTTTVEFNTLPAGEDPTTNTNTSQYTIEETINGTVFLVTRTRFPDGTTSVISSVPKP